MRNGNGTKQILRVLLVEDNPDDAALILRQLKKSNGFEIIMERVETEPEVRSALHAKTWDIIICDFSLPDLDAIRVIEILNIFGLDIPFILVSGKITQAQAARVLDKGVHEFVSKDKLSRLGPVIHRELRLASAYDDTLRAWSRALEIRDHETRGHSERVTHMTVRLARALGISETEIIHIRRGALLHDVGKMGVSDNVLLKPDKLTDEEFQRMKKHPQVGFEMLEPIEFLKKSLDIPHYHHEKWDGTGYPRGLKGEEIPLHARIFSVVDVFDAMTSDRPYRQALGHAFVLKFIQDQAGKSFDPQIVKVFLSLFPAEKVEN